MQSTLNMTSEMILFGEKEYAPLPKGASKIIELGPKSKAFAGRFNEPEGYIKKLQVLVMASRPGLEEVWLV